MPLKVIRDDEDLKLSELGCEECRGPYHIIVGALNLRGSKELNRKTYLSEHYIFSKEYIGSRVTGWVKTEKYNEQYRITAIRVIGFGIAAPRGNLVWQSERQN